MLVVLGHLDLVHVLRRRARHTPIHHVLRTHQGMIIHNVTGRVYCDTCTHRFTF